MLRKTLQYAPFFLPFLGYAIYMVVARVTGRGATWRGAPWLWLTAAGLFFTALALLAFWALEPRSGIDGDYIPPHLENGSVQPGRVSPKGDQ